MASFASALFVVLGSLSRGNVQRADGMMPDPFTRSLRVTEPSMSGNDVYIAAAFLMRSNNNSIFDCKTPSACKFGSAMSNAVGVFQTQQGIPSTKEFDSTTAALALERLSFDGYTEDDSATPASLGYKYKISVSCYRNRSIEDREARLISANGSLLLTFVTRVHGAQTLPVPTWPNFNDSNSGVNEFTGDGATPTGLFELDLNSPEDEPSAFGIWPVNRVTQGLVGNGKVLVGGTKDGTIRDGILVHTGEWSKYSSWKEPEPMPNSNGCIHAYPEAIKAISEILIADGVIMRTNTNGALPYPYKAQGLFSLQLIDSPQFSFPPTAVVPRVYTLYKQCNSKWGSDVIASKTICEVGCLMSSVAMAVNTNNIQIDNNNNNNNNNSSNNNDSVGVGVGVPAVTPQTLNNWLKTHNGYEGDDLIESAVMALDPLHISWSNTNSSHRSADLSMSQIKHLLVQRQPVIANVEAGRHFVLVVGWDSENSDILYVNDPGYNKQTYSFSADVVGYRLYKMTSEKSPTLL